jgi:arylsulfatase A-like enzyme
VTAALTVVLAVVARGLLAGYGGTWFFPVLAADAGRALLPFLPLALLDWRWGRLPARRAAILVVECALLAACFGDGWVEPHTSVARLLGAGLRLDAALLAAGLVVGLVLAAPAIRWPVRVADAAVAALAGWLILGPQAYARFDTVVAGTRLRAGLAITGAFALLALALAGATAALGRRAPRVLAAIGVVVVALTALASAGPHPLAAHDSIVLVVVDTLRADMVDATRTDGTPLMPRLRALAARGVRFTTAVAPSPWTLPSTTSIMSGMNPYRHRVGRMIGGVPAPGDPAASHLGPALRAAGYQLAGFVNNPYLRPYYGFGLGFLRFGRYHGNARDGVAAARGWADRHGGRPFLLLLHLMDPHWPYDAPAGFGDARRPCAECDDLGTLQYHVTSDAVHAEVRRRYAAEVAFTDAALGDFYDALTADGRLAHAWFIVVADHGEELWDHGGFLHGHTLYDELLRVPLVIVPPPGESTPPGQVVDAQVRIEDVAATLIDIAGLPADTAGGAPTLDGRTLLPLITRAAAPDAPRPVVAGFLQIPGGLRYAVRTPHRKLINPTAPGGGWPVLFDLDKDPHETTNVMAQEPLVAWNLHLVPAALGLFPERTAEAAAPAPPARVDRDVERELRSLGYVQ